MSLRNKVFLSFIALITLNILLFKFVFQDIIVAQLKNDRHDQYQAEKEAAEKVMLNQLLLVSNFKDPIERLELEKQLPDDVMYRMLVKDANGNTIYSKTSRAYNLKMPSPSSSNRGDSFKQSDLKVVAEYHFQQEPPRTGEIVVYFYTDDYDMMETTGGFHDALVYLRKHQSGGIGSARFVRSLDTAPRERIIARHPRNPGRKAAGYIYVSIA